MKLGITKGEVSVKTDFREPTLINESGQVMFTHNKTCYDTTDESHVYYSHNRMMANISLVAEAFNVANATGKTPQMLVDDLDKALNELKDVKCALIFCNNPNDKKIIESIEQVINEIQK